MQVKTQQMQEQHYSKFFNSLLTASSWLCSRFKDPKENIVINGFWRSGTTWLLEAICELSKKHGIFEPFEGTNIHMYPYYRSLNVDTSSLKFRNALFPFASQFPSGNTALDCILNNSMTGFLPNSFNLLRNNPNFFRRFINRGLVIKFTRGALLIKPVSEYYKCNIFHIYRDPRSVISSIFCTKKSWGRGSFIDLDLNKLLIEVNDGRSKELESELRIYKENIDLLKNDPVLKVAMYYAITEHYVQRISNNYNQHINILRYEEVASCPQKFKELVVLPLNKEIDDSDIDDCFWRSSSTNNAPILKEKKERFYGWKNTLSKPQSNSIADIMDCFDLGNRLFVG